MIPALITDLADEFYEYNYQRLQSHPIKEHLQIINGMIAILKKLDDVRDHARFYARIYYRYAMEVSQPTMSNPWLCETDPDSPMYMYENFLDKAMRDKLNDND